MFLWNSIHRPIIALAPMAGYTDSAYRQLVKEICPAVVCFSELTSVSGLLHGNESTLRQISFNPEKERPIVIQIFGNKPETFCKAAKALAELGADAIDINMGCPARKIVSSDHGSALLKNPTLAFEIVKAAAEGSPLPVSVKMRIGISQYDEEHFLKFAKSMENAGASLLTIHGRTAKQMYGGEANWEPIYKVKKILNIPVIGNGDIKNGTDAVLKLKNLDGIMVGRATLGNPWIFQEITAAFQNKTFIKPELKSKIAVIKKHVQLACELHGERRGILEMRKQLMHYIRGIPKASEARQRLCTISTENEVIEVLEKL